MAQIYDFKVPGNKGTEVDLGQFRGKVLLIVNTASKCGFTPQYDGLNIERFGPAAKPGSLEDKIKALL